MWKRSQLVRQRSQLSENRRPGAIAHYPTAGRAVELAKIGGEPMTRAAFFDVDGTLLKSNIVHHYLYLATQDRSIGQRWHVTARLASLAPYYLLLDRISRDQFNQLFYQNYRDFLVSDCREWGQRYFQAKMRSTIFPGGMEQIAQHQRQGLQIVLVTGSVDFVMTPLAEFLGADRLITTQLQVNGDRYTGELEGLPVANQEKARLMNAFADEHGIDLANSYAYGDSIADLPMLNAVGQAIAVNPDAALRQVALQAGWTIKQWQIADKISLSPHSPAPSIYESSR
jgi:alcohol-forming fatty acyl-CoA reductase